MIIYFCFPFYLHEQSHNGMLLHYIQNIKDMVFDLTFIKVYFTIMFLMLHDFSLYDYNNMESKQQTLQKGF